MKRTDKLAGCLTPDQRLREVAELLAGAVIRLRLRAALPTEQLRPPRIHWNLPRIPLRFRLKRGSVSTRVNDSGDLTRS